MATRNIVNVGLSGASGSVKFVGSTSPTLVTPTLGAATATSVAFSPTTGGIIGTTAADDAGAGKVGEMLSSQILSASAISILNITAKTLTSVTLTAGDWDVWGNLTFIFTGISGLSAGGVSTTDNTLPDGSLYNDVYATYASAATTGIVAPLQRINVSGNTTIYIVGYTSFSTGTATFCGGVYARRRR